MSARVVPHKAVRGPASARCFFALCVLICRFTPNFSLFSTGVVACIDFCTCCTLSFCVLIFQENICIQDCLLILSWMVWGEQKKLWRKTLLKIFCPHPVPSKNRYIPHGLCWYPVTANNLLKNLYLHCIIIHSLVFYSMYCVHAVTTK